MTGRSSALLCLVLLLAGCASHLPEAEHATPVVWTRLLDIPLSEPVRKACYDPLHQTLYLLLGQSNSIAVYREGKQVNTLGGLGYGDTQFSRLADIALGPDGKLLALDSFRAHIKRFDHNGELVSTIQLDDLTDPRLLAASTGGRLYVWDATRRDITLITDPPADESYTFGRFQLEQPAMLCCTTDWVWAWDGDETVLFNAMGQYRQTLPGHVHLNRRGQRFALHQAFVQPLPQGEPLAMAPFGWQTFWLREGYMSLASANRLWLGRLDNAPR